MTAMSNYNSIPITRRYYRLTEKGHKTLAKDRNDWREVSNAVTFILEEA